jgi:hypothetical protein
MPLLPLLPPTRPLLILATLAVACAAVLTVEGVLLLSGRERQSPGWRFGVLLLLGSLVAVALAARLEDIHAELIRGSCSCQPFQWTEPDLATPLILGTVLGSAVLAFTVYGSVRTLRFVRSPSAPDDQSRAASAWPFSGNLFVLVLMMDAGIWFSVNALPHVAELAYLINQFGQVDGMGIGPLLVAIAFPICGALLLLIPLTILLRALYRSRRATS